MASASSSKPSEARRTRRELHPDDALVIGVLAEHDRPQQLGEALSPALPR